MGLYEKPVKLKKRGKNRKRRESQPILMVNARVVEKRKERTHRMGAVVFLVAVMGGILWLVIAGTQHLGRLLFSENTYFQIHHLEIDNPEGKLTKGHITEYAQIAYPVNLFEVDIHRIRQDLESVPLIKSVTVQRKLPDTLAIHITERTAVAKLDRAQQGFYLAVDNEGYVLGPSLSSPYLPSITGYRDTEVRPGDYISERYFHDALEVLDYCDTPRLSQTVKIGNIDIRHPEYLEVRLRGGEQIYLSREEMGSKLKKLPRILQLSRAEGRAVASIDLTVNKNFPVTYR